LHNKIERHLTKLERKCGEDYLDLFYIVANQTVIHLNGQAESNG